MSRSKTRLYFGKLREDIRERDLEKFVRGYGQVRDISLKRGYGFVVSLFKVQTTCKFAVVLFQLILRSFLWVQLPKHATENVSYCFCSE